MIFDSVAYKAVVSNGLVLDKNGNKMSKRLGNAVDPFSTIEKYGSDPLRWYMITNASPWDNIKFDIDGIEEVAVSSLVHYIIRILSSPSTRTWMASTTPIRMWNGASVRRLTLDPFSVEQLGEGCGWLLGGLRADSCRTCYL